MQFYNSLQPASRLILDSADGGRFDNVELADAENIIEQLAVHHAQYSRPQKTVGAVSNSMDVDSLAHFQATLDAFA
jgi:hypothetical protein